MSEKFIERKAEEEIFASLLKCQDEARLLTIEDVNGRGKTTLLKILQYNCRWRTNPPVSVSRVSHDLIEKVVDGFSFIEFIRQDLEQYASPVLIFTQFDKLNRARMNYNFGPFRERNPDLFLEAKVGSSTGIVTYKDSKIINSDSIGIQFKDTQQVIIKELPSAKWDNPIKEALAREECVNAFFEDLRTISEKCGQPIIFLIDAWGQCNEKLQNFILERILRPLCFDKENRPDKLIFVIAGEHIPPFSDMLGSDYPKIARSINTLSEWDEEHVQAFLKLHNCCEGLDNDEIQFLCKKIKGGLSLISAQEWAKIFRGR